MTTPLPAELSGFRQLFLCFGLMLGFLLATLDTCIVAVPLIIIGEELSNFTSAPWAILAYLLSYMAFAVIIPHFSDVYGRRNMLLASWLVFVAFSLGCGSVATMTQLIICRAFQGIGGSGLYSITQIGIAEVGPTDKPALIGAMIGTTLAIAFTAGPIIGGAITVKSTWRWIFYINAPIGLVAMVIIACLWPYEPRNFPLCSFGAFLSIDHLGGLTLLAASSLTVFGLQWGGSQLAEWASLEVAGTLSVAFVCWCSFFLRQRAFARGLHKTIRPLFPGQLASDLMYMASLVPTFSTGFSFVTLTIIIPQRIQVVTHENTMTSSLHLLPMLGACAVGCFLSGAICRKHNWASELLLIATIVQFLGLAWLTYLQPPAEEVGPAYALQALFGLGAGIALSSATIIASVNTNVAENLAVANGLMAQARALGGCVGIAVSTIVFNQWFNDVLGGTLDWDELQTVHRSPNIISTWEKDAESRASAEEAYTRAYYDMHKVMCILAILSAGASVTACCRTNPFARMLRNPA